MNTLKNFVGVCMSGFSIFQFLNELGLNCFKLDRLLQSVIPLQLNLTENLYHVLGWALEILLDLLFFFYFEVLFSERLSLPPHFFNLLLFVFRSDFLQILFYFNNFIVVSDLFKAKLCKQLNFPLSLHFFNLLVLSSSVDNLNVLFLFDSHTRQ